MTAAATGQPVPVDFSDCSRSAFQVARALAWDHGARLVVLHVPTPPPFVTLGELGRALERRDGYRGELMDDLRRLYPADASAGVDYRLQEGSHAAEILGVADEAACDLIVMGTHGRSGLARLLLGSVAEKVLHKAACPVVTVKVPAAPPHPPKERFIPRAANSASAAVHKPDRTAASPPR
jgi:nucleotide-binding universal stress UspA family protein